MVSLTVLHRLLKQTDNITELTSSFSKPIKTLHFGQKCRLCNETNTALPRFAIQNVRHNVKNANDGDPRNTKRNFKSSIHMQKQKYECHDGIHTNRKGKSTYHQLSQ